MPATRPDMLTTPTHRSHANPGPAEPAHQLSGSRPGLWRGNIGPTSATTIATLLSSLNDRQREAVEHPGGPLLVIAGPGSGKTAVLTTRIAYLVMERRVRPDRILAVTFTNRAADEIRSRLTARLGHEAARALHMGTIHSFCCRALRRNSYEAGVPEKFVIYDEDDQRRLLRPLVKMFPPGDLSLHDIRDRISAWKTRLRSPQDIGERAEAARDRELATLARLYLRYETALRDNRALDFDDLLVYTYRMFDHRPDVLRQFQTAFDHVLVDEYQDVTWLEDQTLRALARVHQNFCAVGDDDQAIYEWRGADLASFRSLKDDFPSLSVVPLGQNYRSTGHIVQASAALIAPLDRPYMKRLWTANALGVPVERHDARTDQEEADYVIETIMRHLSAGGTADQVAVLYRTHAQSAPFQDALAAHGIPFRVIGGLAFYAHKDTKDVLAFLRTALRPDDTSALKRIANTPARGLGPRLMARLQTLAHSHRTSLWMAMKILLNDTLVRGRERTAVAGLVGLIEGLAWFVGTHTAGESVSHILTATKYRAMVAHQQDDDGARAIARLDRLADLARVVDADHEGRYVEAFLDHIALQSRADALGTTRDSVTLSTIHGAKGLEWPLVVVAGLDDALLPHYTASTSNELAAERRLCYVAMTRAQRRLILTRADEHVLNGERRRMEPSPFLRELEHLVPRSDGAPNEDHYHPETHLKNVLLPRGERANNARMP